MNSRQKNLLTLLVLTGVAGALGLYAWFGVMKPDEAARERKESSEKLFAAHAPGERSADGGAPPAPVLTRLTVTAKGETTVLEKGASGKWRLTAPVSAPADQAAVDSLVSELSSARFKATIEESPADADLERYGLKTPKFSVRAQAYVPDESGGGASDPARQKEVSLQGGLENTFDGSVYLRREGDPKVYAAPGSVRYALEKNTYELRDKEVLPLEEAKLRQLEVKTTKNAYTLARDEKRAWRVQQPVAMAADGPLVIQMIGALRGEQAFSFPQDSPEERRRLGLETPALDAWLTPESGERIHIRAARAAGGDGQRAYVLREQGAEAVLAEVSAGVLDHLDRSAQELRDKAVLSFKKEDVARLAFKPAGGGPEIVLERVQGADAGAEDWVVTAPEKGPAKKWKVSSILWSLSSLKAAGFGQEAPRDWGKFGLDDKARTAAAYDAAGNLLAKLWVGKDVPGKSATAYVRGTPNQVLEMETARLMDLPAAVADVLDKPAPAGVQDAGIAPFPPP